MGLHLNKPVSPCPYDSSNQQLLHSGKLFMGRFRIFLYVPMYTGTYFN